MKGPMWESATPCSITSTSTERSSASRERRSSWRTGKRRAEGRVGLFLFPPAFRFPTSAFGSRTALAGEWHQNALDPLAALRDEGVDFVAEVAEGGHGG